MGFSRCPSLAIAMALAVLAVGTNCATAQHIQAFLEAHNQERMQMGVPALHWDDEVAAYSLWWTNHQKDYESCAMRHSDGPYGENLFWGSPGKEWSPHDAVKSWVDEKQHFNYEGNSCAQMCGHYTQLVWRDSTKLGCATATCPNGDTLISCNYDPPGNYIGQRPF
ncbi:pathogenesis-related protein PRB1-2 [Selaginella moellendorffii]|nr:pathogenesis-related protein PRB1-2 [Selaginella moellendorffii]|eukprot:XP_002983458.2 pathogenesis-related protein PRB1-2 [Selaginella moellendorffii]